MNPPNSVMINDVFAKDVLQGLSSTPKFLSSRYFYDEIGDDLFQQIMKMPEYYLTRSEFEIFENKKDEILSVFSNDGRPFQLVEFGAGDGTKTKVLLEHFLEKKASFTYLPIDISENVLRQLTKDLENNLPELSVEPQQGEYFEALGGLSNGGRTRKVILFLGSNIGNFKPTEARKFLRKMASNLHVGDLLFIGLDLKKKPSLILDAYNDKGGITKAFNVNLLNRINKELGGNFETSDFEHFPTYNPQTGEMKSFLVSNKRQEVTIEALNKTIHFDAWESIYMEVSQKYSLQEINAMASEAGFKPVENLFDSNHYYVDCIWEVV